MKHLKYDREVLIPLSFILGSVLGGLLGARAGGGIGIVVFLAIFLPMVYVTGYTNLIVKTDDPNAAP
jgi:hypothetical protein